MANDGKTVETVTDFIFLGSKSLQMLTEAMKLKDPAGWYGEGRGRRVQDGEHMYTN